MKKNFPLQQPGRADARVLETLKNEVRKYVQREQRKTPPAGFDRWEFACRVGRESATAVPCRLSEVIAAIETATKDGAISVYVEILAQPVRRAPAADDPGAGADSHLG